MTRTNATTKAIIRYLLFTGKFKVWRNNNGAVFDRKRNCYRKNPTALLGLPDICGYKKVDGKAQFIGIEVKVGKDVLSEPQNKFLSELKTHGGISLVVKSFDDFQMQYLQLK